STLAVTGFVTCKKKRNALGQHQARELVLAKLTAERQDYRIISRSFVAAIVAEIIIGAIAIILAVGFVVLLVIGKQIRQGEAVMDGNVIDAGARCAVIVV